MWAQLSIQMPLENKPDLYHVIDEEPIEKMVARIQAIWGRPKKQLSIVVLLNSVALVLVRLRDFIKSLPRLNYAAKTITRG